METFRCAICGREFPQNLMRACDKCHRTVCAMCCVTPTTSECKECRQKMANAVMWEVQRQKDQANAYLASRGLVPGPQRDRVCPHCNGRGTIRKPAATPIGPQMIAVACPLCGGTGRLR